MLETNNTAEEWTAEVGTTIVYENLHRLLRNGGGEHPRLDLPSKSGRMDGILCGVPILRLEELVVFTSRLALYEVHPG